MNSKIYEDLSLVQRRSRTTLVVVGIVFVLLVLIFWNIQILEHKKYWNRSEANRIREIVILPQRGLITARDGEILAQNNASFKVSIIREECEDQDESCRKISRLLNIQEQVLKERIGKYRSLASFQPIVIKDNLSADEVALIESRQLELPELILQTEPKRKYPYNTLAAHVLGYLQELSMAESKMERYKERHLGDLVGKTGIEREYEDMLLGKEGRLIEIVDSLGRIKDQILRREPVQGKRLVLTLDYDLQKKSEELLAGREGAIVVLDPENGEILALTSYPTFDPNKFINRFTPEEWLELVNSPEYPLENRAIRGLYSPGSIFKPAMILAALDSHTITENTRYYCEGSISIYGRPFSCWYKPGHGSVDLISSLQNSCNVYFYQLGKAMGIKDIAMYAQKMGFGNITGIDLPGEKPGLVPTAEWKLSTRNSPWYPGETISVAIGQGPFTVTPIQVAVYTALIANRGEKSIRPRLLLDEDNNSSNFGNQSPRIDPSMNGKQISSAFFEKVVEGMWRAVNREGTARAVRINGLEICGKTGSTQVVSRETADKLAERDITIETHSWFTGFAPKMEPEIVITILVEYGGMGGIGAAPIAREIFATYMKNNDH